MLGPRSGGDVSGLTGLFFLAEAGVMLGRQPPDCSGLTAAEDTEL